MEETGRKDGTTETPGLSVGSGLPVLPPAAALLEIILLVVVPGLLDYFVPGFPSLNDTQPHFFWLPVVMLSAQYGSLSGLLAAGAAIVLASLLGWPEQDIGENHFSYLLRIWLQPVLWIATAVILGQFRLRQIEKKASLGRAVEELTSQRHAIAEHARNLRARCDHLERLIATQHAPDAQALLAALGRIQSDDPDIADRALHDTLHLAFGDCQASIFVIDRGNLRLATRHAGGERVPGNEALAASEPLYVATIVEGRQLSILDPGDEADLRGRGLAAVPIIAPDRTTSGLLLLESAAAHDIDETITTRLSAVAALISLRLSDGLRTASNSPPPYPVATPADRLTPTGRRGWRHVKWRHGGQHSQAVRASGRSG